MTKEEQAVKNALLQDDEQKDVNELEEPEEDEVESMDEEPESDSEVSAESMARMLEARQLLQVAADSRRKYDREWLSRDLFRRGYHFVSQNSSTGSISLRSTSKARIPINYLQAFVRSIKNQVTSFNPKWEVLPEYKGEQAEEAARLSGKLLDSLYFKMQMGKKVKEAVIQGLIYSVGGPFEVIWDEDYDNGPHEPKGEVVVVLHDPYDIYIDPNATCIEEAEFIIKAIRTSVEKIRNNANYNETARKMVKTGSAKQAESEYKQFLLQTISSSNSVTQTNEATIVYEMQRKEIKDDGNVSIRYFTFCDESPIPLRDELFDQEEYDMEFFQADMNPLELYGESWAKHVIAANRVLDALESSIFEYNYKMAKGRIVIDKNSDIKAITNEHGTIIEKARGSEVAQLPIQSLPATTENQVARFRTYLSDLSGVQDPMLGRVPVGIKSGIGLAELKQSSASNQDDLVQALEDCLMRVGRKVLKKVAKHYTTPRIRRVVGHGRMVEHFAVVGEGYIDKGKTEWTIGKEKYPLARIATNNELKVQIGSWLNYSKEAQQKTIMDLAEAGLISQEDVLKYLEFPDVQDVLDRTRAEKIIELKRKEVPQMPIGISQEELALSENEMLLEGAPVPIDPQVDDHELHIAVHQRAISGGKFDQFVQDHIQEHRNAEQVGVVTPSAQAPQQPMAQPAPQQMPAQPQQMPPQIPMPQLNQQQAVPMPQ